MVLLTVVDFMSTATAQSIRRSTITGNSADGFGSVGGGIAMHGDVLVINSTVTGNSAASSAGSGGGIATIKGDTDFDSFNRHGEFGSTREGRRDDRDG